MGLGTVGASPSGKAPVFGTGIRRFESSRPSQFSQLDRMPPAWPIDPRGTLSFGAHRFLLGIPALCGHLEAAEEL